MGADEVFDDEPTAGAEEVGDDEPTAGADEVGAAVLELLVPPQPPSANAEITASTGTSRVLTRTTLSV